MTREFTAIIPVAGKGTRLAPMTRVLPKAMFPLVGGDGAVRPVADWIAREALAAGCTKICFVCSDDQQVMLEAYFAGEPALAGLIQYVGGVEPYGFGYAVWSARKIAGPADVLVLLGDHIHLPDPGQAPPTRQVADAFASSPARAMIGMQVVEEKQLHLVGACRGLRLSGRTYRCDRIIEKPKGPQVAEVASPELPAGKYFAHAGIYALANEIMDCLDHLVARRAPGKEVGLTEAQQMLLERHRGEYLLYHLAGSTHDTGTAENYLASLRALAQSSL